MRSHLAVVIVIAPLWLTYYGCGPLGQSPSKEILIANDIQPVAGGTGLGVPLTLPSDLPWADISMFLSYSPNGQMIAARTTSGSIALIDLEQGTWSDVKQEFLGGSNHSLCDLVWLTSSRALISELSTDPGQVVPGRQPGLPQGTLTVGYREIDIDTRETIALSAMPDSDGPDFMLVCGRLEDGSYVGVKQKYMRVAVKVDSLPGVDETLLAELDGNDRFIGHSACRFPWIPLAPKPSRGAYPTLVDAELTYLNLQSGERKTIAHVNYTPSYVPPLLTEAGDFLFTVRRDAALCKWIPEVIRTEGGVKLTLPESESWMPVALSEARGVLLVVVPTPTGGDGPDLDFYEIPLSALLGHE